MAARANKKNGPGPNSVSPATKLYYLRKRGTNIVCIRTALLAKRPDMDPVSDAVAKTCIAAQRGDSQARVQAYRAWKAGGGHGQPPQVKSKEAEKLKMIEEGLIPPEESDGTPTNMPPPDPLAGLSMADLAAKAVELKIVVDPDATEDSLRADLSALMAADTDSPGLPPETEEPPELAPEQPPEEK